MKKVMNYKIKFILTAVLLIVATLAVFGLVACKIDDVESISVTPDEVSVKIGEFNFDDYSVTATYGSGKVESFKLTEDMLSAKDRVNLFVEGNHEITVSYQRKTTTLKVNIERNVFYGATFDDLDVVYTGEFYTVEVKNVPEGTTVTYPTTNRFRNAGEYEATAILRKDAYEMKEMKAKIVIRKADYDLSETVFENKSEVYDGEMHFLPIDGELPSGLYVDYTITREGGKEEKGNGARNAGVYTVHATFTGDQNNFNAVEPIDAVLTIERASIDMSGVSFEDKTEVYDRTRHVLELEGELPAGVTVSYENNEHVDAGEYVAKAVFNLSDSVNYAPIDDRVAVLTVLKAEYDMSAVHFDSLNTPYDGTEKKIELQGKLPVGVTVTYENNVGTNAGTYGATATFVGSDKNYNDPAPIEATLVITPVEAPIDQIRFVRTRFISLNRRLIGDDLEDSYYWGEIDEETYERLKNYNPYHAAMAYRPTDVPAGLTVKEVKYCKTEGWVEDLTAYGQNDDFVYTDEITEDGYYVVIVTYDGNGNYVALSPVRTQIRTSTVDDFNDNAIYAYGESADGSSGAFYDYSYGTCTNYYKNESFGQSTIEYCNCNIFNEYRHGGNTELHTLYHAVIDDETLKDYTDIAAKYYEYVSIYGTFYFYQNHFGVPTGIKNSMSKCVDDLLEAAEKAANRKFSDTSAFSFDRDKFGIVSLDFGIEVDNVALSSLDNVQNLMTTSEAKKIAAALLGYTDYDVMQNDLKEVAKEILNARNVASMDSAAARCKYKGSVYSKCSGEKGDKDFYVFPYMLSWADPDSQTGEIKRLYAYLIISNLSGDNELDASLIVNDVNIAKEFIALENKTVDINVYGRCSLVEEEVWKWDYAKLAVTENGKTVMRRLTSLNELSLITGSVDNVEENRYVYKFVTTLPGNCSKESAYYNAEDYAIVTDLSILSYCDDNPFAYLIKNSGDVSGITTRFKRDDHAQLSDEIASIFDLVAEYFDAFISNYNISDGIVNEWRIGANNHNYAAFESFFDYARVAYFFANRNIGTDLEYAVKDSAIIGMNRAFAISASGSGVSYTVDAYRSIVAKLFGFDDVMSLTEYSDTLAKTLIKNEMGASTEFNSTRMIYDGALYTSGGYFVLPYVIKTDLSDRYVYALMFVGRDGNMSVWINDARNAFNAVNFPTDSEEKTKIEVIGRCILFEDDGYTMIENLGDDVFELIDRLKGVNLFDRKNYEEVPSPVAIETIKSIAAAGEYLMRVTYTDSEGFFVLFDSIYDYENDENTETGFYTYFTIVDVEDIKAYNERMIAERETNNDSDDSDDSGNDPNNG